MANRNMNLDVIVRLRDMLSGPLRRLRGTLDHLASFARKIGIVGAAIAGISFMGPIQEAAAFQQKLVDIAVTQGLMGAGAFDAIAEMKGQFQDLARSVGIYSSDIAGAAGQMIAAGLDPKLVRGSIGDIAKAATAANADINDMASVGTALMQNLKLPADQLYNALDALVVAGKLGSFELKNMAQYFPNLTGQMTKFGVSGREAVNFLGAGLQIARKGTADPAEAANNLQNFLQKILMPETKKNFAEMGVDIEGVMKNAATKGINPIEAVIQKIISLTGDGGKEIEGLMQKAKANGLEGADALASVREQLEQIHGAGKLGNLFGDMQVMNFLIPMLSNVEEFKRIKAEIAAASGTTIGGDFDTQMQGMTRQLNQFYELIGQIKDEIGSAFGTWLPKINETIGMALDMFREFDTDTGGMGKQILAIGGAAVIASVGIGALGLVLPIVTAGIAAMVAPLRLVTGLMRGISKTTAGLGGVADNLNRINDAAAKAGRIGRPSIWSMLFGLENAISLTAAIPDDANELQKFMDENKKKAEGWNAWLEKTISTPRSWLGLDNQPEIVPKIELNSLDELKANLTGLTQDWPPAAQTGMRDFLTALTNGGVDAELKADSIGKAIKANLEVMAKPVVDTGELENALKLATELGGALRALSDAGRISLPPMPSVHREPANGNAEPAGKIQAAPGKQAALVPAVSSVGNQPSRNAVDVGGTLQIALADGLVLKQAEANDKRVTMNSGRMIGRV